MRAFFIVFLTAVTLGMAALNWPSAGGAGAWGHRPTVVLIVVATLLCLAAANLPRRRALARLALAAVAVAAVGALVGTAPMAGVWLVAAAIEPARVLWPRSPSSSPVRAELAD